MKTSLLFSVLISASALLATTASGKEAAPADQAAQLLARNGSLPVNAAGPYVEAGTYEIQVVVKLGRPTFKLPDGTWLYRDFQVENSDARGTLLVRFQDRKVASLTLVTRAVELAMLAPKKAPDAVLASNGR